MDEQFEFLQRHLELEFLWRHLEHVWGSIEIFDEKAAAVIAIGVGTFFVAFELMHRAEFDPRTQKTHSRVHYGIVCGAMLLLLATIGLALHSIYPPAGIADTQTIGGEHLRPDIVVHRAVGDWENERRDYTLPSNKEPALLAQQDYRYWMMYSTYERKAEELSALAWSRMMVRDWKVSKLRKSIWALASAIVLMFGAVVSFVIGRLSTKPHASSKDASEAGRRPRPRKPRAGAPETEPDATPSA